MSESQGNENKASAQAKAPKHPSVSIGRDAAIALANSSHWTGKTAREIAGFQLFTVELSMDFSLFHKSLEESLGRAVFTHEMGLNWDGLVAEFLGETPAPTFADILNLIPEDKRILVVAA